MPDEQLFNGLNYSLCFGIGAEHYQHRNLLESTRFTVYAMDRPTSVTIAVSSSSESCGEEMISLHDLLNLCWAALPIVAVCDQIIRNSISFGNATGHEEILADALRELGYNVVQQGNTLQFTGNGHSGTYANGQFNTTENRYSSK